VETLRSHGSDEKNEKHNKIPNSADNNLVEQRNLTMELMQACHCGMATIVKENSTQSSVIIQQGQNLKLKGCYCFLRKVKNGGVEHHKVPERPFASEVKCCHCTLYLIVPPIIQLDMLHTGTCQQESASDSIEMNSVVGVDQLVEILHVHAWENDSSNTAAQECRS
jgi:hypothetical protein